MGSIFLVLVLLDGVKSAEPPMVVESSPLMTSSTFSEYLRVPAGFSPLIFSFKAASAGASDAGSAPDIAASKSLALGEAALRVFQSSRAPLPWPPMARH